MTDKKRLKERLLPESSQKQDSAHEYFVDMKLDMDMICIQLFVSSQEFNAERVFDAIYAYVLKHDRILYAVISNHIFETESEQKLGQMETNIDTLVEYLWSDRYKTRESEGSDSDKDKLQRTKKAILKIYDHVNLARRQFASLRDSDEDFKKRFEANITPFRTEMMKDKTEMMKDTSAQLITLVGIFTAIAFIVFGGISSMEMMFTLLQKTSLVRVVIVGSLWSLCIINLIFIFLFCIGKITGTPFESAPDGNIVKRYPIVWWSNLLMCTIFLAASWVHISTQEGVLETINWSTINGLFFIAVFFIGCILWLIEKS